MEWRSVPATAWSVFAFCFHFYFHVHFFIFILLYLCLVYSSSVFPAILIILSQLRLCCPVLPLQLTPVSFSQAVPHLLISFSPRILSVVISQFSGPLCIPHTSLLLVSPLGAPPCSSCLCKFWCYNSFLFIMEIFVLFVSCLRWSAVLVRIVGTTASLKLFNDVVKAFNAKDYSTVLHVI